MLKKQFRLKRRQDFRRVYQRGKSLKNRAFVLCFRRVTGPKQKIGHKQVACFKQPCGPRLGFSVSKQIGNAVERNRVRRKLREACRLELAAFAAGFDYVLIARQGAKAESVQGLRKKLLKTLQEGGLLSTNKQPKKIAVQAIDEPAVGQKKIGERNE